MANLETLEQNLDEIQDGRWIDVGDRPEDRFRIKTRGQTTDYLVRLSEFQRDEVAALNRKLAVGAAPWRVDNLPVPSANKCQGQAMAETTFLDVSGLDYAGAPVTAARYKEFLLNHEKYPALIFFALAAMGKVHAELLDEAREAQGNSQAASAGS